MATLNYNWQELGRVTFYSTSSASDTVGIEGRVVSQSTSNNTSKIQLRWVNYGSWWYTSSGTVAFTGTYTDSTSCATYPTKINKGDVFYSIEKTVSHSSDGTKSISVGGTISAYISGQNRSGTISNVSVTLPKIDRYATVTGAVDFNDEGTPSMTFTNPAGFRINARLEFGNTAISRNNISSTGSYTFELTTEERNTLRQQCTGKTMTVRYVVATCLSGTTESYWSFVDKTMTIVNADPSATYTIAEQDANVISLLGSSSANKVVINASDLLFTITPTTLKYATISSVTINGLSATLNNNVYTYQYNNVPTNVFSVVVIDSRGNSTTYTITKTLIDYLVVKINSMSAPRASQTSSDLKLTADITCYSSTIDGNTNTPTVQYSTDGTNWTTISSSSYTFTDNKITITNLTLSNLISYQSTGTLYLKCTDLLTSNQDNKAVAVGIYTFAKSDRKVRINGTLEVADASGNNRVNVMSVINSLLAVSVQEMGSNTNGNYIKYTNGVLICYKTVSRQVAMTTAWSSMYEGSASLGDWAVSFNEKPIVFVNNNSDGGAFVESMSPAPTKTSCGTVFFARPNSSSPTLDIAVLGIGTWK